MGNLTRLFITTGVFLVIYIGSVIFIALNEKERVMIHSFLIGKLRKA